MAPASKSSQPDAVNAWQKDDSGKPGKPQSDATPDQLTMSRAKGNEQEHSDTDKAEHKDMHGTANKVLDESTKLYDKPPSADKSRPSPDTHSKLNRSSKL